MEITIRKKRSYFFFFLISWIEIILDRVAYHALTIIKYSSGIKTLFYSLVEWKYKYQDKCLYIT